ncbi:MAG: lycopene cyclase domain-containing protein [Microbacteriaceae bacterium]
MSYLWLSLLFLTIAAGVLATALLSRRGTRQLLARWFAPIIAAGLVVLTLTALFDNVMIQAGLMTYAASTLSGLHIGLAPLEDFAYPLAGLMLLPALWLLFGSRGSRDR